MDYKNDKFLILIENEKNTIIDKLDKKNYITVQEKTILYKQIKSLNVFQEIYYNVWGKHIKNDDEVINIFKKASKNFIDSCKQQPISNGTSWSIHLYIYEKLLSRGF